MWDRAALWPQARAVARVPYHRRRRGEEQRHLRYPRMHTMRSVTRQRSPELPRRRRGRPQVQVARRQRSRQSAGPAGANVQTTTLASALPGSAHWRVATAMQQRVLRRPARHCLPQASAPPPWAAAVTTSYCSAVTPIAARAPPTEPHIRRTRTSSVNRCCQPRQSCRCVTRQTVRPCMSPFAFPRSVSLGPPARPGAAPRWPRCSSSSRRWVMCRALHPGSGRKPSSAAWFQQRRRLSTRPPSPTAGRLRRVPL